MSKERVSTPKERKRYIGRVKAVPSGDTVVLIELDQATSGDQPPSEIELTLAGIQAPFLSRNNTSEQPWAWESREFLRRLCIGKKVQYTVNYRAGNRCFGEIFLKDTDVRLKVIQEGWAQVRTKDDGNKQAQKRQTHDLDQLLAEEEKAKKAQIGIWNPDKKNAVRQIKEKFDLIQFFTNNRNKPLHAIVEHVKTGTTLKLYLVNESQYITINLSGAQSPIYRFNLPEEQQEPFANAARFFTECCLLHKDVDVFLEAVDEKNLYGTVLYNGKNIVLELLRQGLARLVDWTAKATKNYEELKKAEEEAQQKRLRIWKEFDPEDLPPSHPFEFVGKVVNIVNIGTFEVAETITDIKTGRVSVQKYKISLSAVKVPQLWSKEELEKTKNTPQYAQNQFEAVYAWEAREYLRKKLIGKKVRCVQDYIRPASQRRDGKGPVSEKDFWSVYLIEGNQNVNVALDLISQGYATLVPLKEIGLRPEQYSQMVLAQEEARRAGRGLHSSKTEGVTLHINDLSYPKLPNDMPKLRNILSFLQRGGRKSAVVETVFNGCTVKLWIPSETCMISFGIQGIRCEKVQKSNDPIPKILPNAEGSKAYFFTKDTLHQHDIEIEVDALDKNGRFLGALFFNKKNFGTLLLEEGWAFLNLPIARNTKYYEEYVQAENKAKAARKNHWENWDPAAEGARSEKQKKHEQNRQTQSRPNEMWSIRISEILDGCNFYFQIVNDELKTLENLEKALRDKIAQEQQPALFDHEKDGPLCAAQFSADGQWYRAEVKGIAKDGEFVVQYIDYGNMETVPNIPNRLRKLDASFNENVLPRQARPGKLAFITTPQIDDEFGSDAAALFKELVWGKELLSKVHFVDNVTGAYHLFVGEPSRQVPVNFALVRAGLARVERRNDRDQDQVLLEKLREEEEAARNKRLNLWQYGIAPDEDEDEDDEDSKRRRK